MGGGSYRIYLILALGCLLCYNSRGQAQPPSDDDTCAIKTPKLSPKELRKKKAEEAAQKALTYISYLNYSDRTFDRVLSGPAEFESYKGKTIRHISICILPPFGATIDQGTVRQSKIERFANSVQFKTHEWTVKNELLFETGEKVDPMKFADTEKNIWDRGTFKDLKILITPVDEAGNTVDVTIIVQERWSWSISTSAQYNKAVVGIEFCNVAGMPQSLYQKVSFNYRKDDPYTIYGGYEFDNIRRSHIDASAEYQYENLSKGADAGITRNFFSSTSKWAFSALGGAYREMASVPNPYAAAIPTNILYNYQDIWVGTSGPAADLGIKNNGLLKWVFAARYYRMQYNERPFKISEDGSQVFLNHSYLLGGLGLATWNYYVSQDVFTLHKSEYFSKGFNVALITGLDDDEELNKRLYSGIQMNYGEYIPRFGYLNNRISYGGFLNDSIYDQLLLKISSRFFSEAIPLGRKFRLRQVISGTVNYGFRRPDDRLIAMNNSDGVRGIFVNDIRGERTYVLNLETDLYANFKVLGFSSALFAFADLALVQQGSYFGGGLTQGYGVGLRLRSLAIGISFFELSFVYYPHLEIPGDKPYTFVGTTNLTHGIPQDNLFLPAALTPDN